MAGADVFRRLILLDGNPREVFSIAIEHMRTHDAPIVGVVKLHVADVKSVVQRYVKRQLSSDDVYQWADLLEMSDWVDYHEPDVELIAELLMALSSPEICGPLNEQSANELLDRLEKS